MDTPITAKARLHALLGDAARHLAPHHLQRIEAKLIQQEGDGVAPPLITALQQMQTTQSADGTAWLERKLHPGRCHDMVRASRGLAGLNSVLRLLHAAHLTARNAAPPQCLPDTDRNGLWHAAHVLVDTSTTICTVVPERLAPSAVMRPRRSRRVR